MRGFGELAVERHSSTCRPGEQQSVDAVVPGQGTALIGSADEQADDAFGNACFVKALDQHRAGRGGLLRRLEHYCIARDQRRYDVAIGQMRREIIRSEYAKHAMRFVAHRHLVAQRCFKASHRGALAKRVDRNFDLVDDRADFGPRFPKRLARFARDEVGEILLAGAHDVGEAAQGLDPIGHRMRRPFGQGGTRGGYFDRRVADRPGPDLRSGRRFEGNQLFGHDAPPLAALLPWRRSRVKPSPVCGYRPPPSPRPSGG